MQRITNTIGLAQHVMRVRIKRWSMPVLSLFIAIGPAALLVGHASASTPQAVVGMPFSGNWAWNVLISPPYTDSNSSYPSVHHTPGGGDWATDIYAPEGTAVKLSVPTVTGTLSFSWKATSTTCGQSTGINILVNGTNIGWLYYAHLNNAVTSGAITNGMTLGTVHDWGGCNPGVHVHTEFKNTTNYSCYVDNGQAGVMLNYGTNFAVLGSSNTGAQQACSSIPAGGGTTGSPARSDVDNNGGADLFAMVPSQTGSAGYVLVSTWQSFLTQYWWDGTGYGWSGVTPLVGDVNGDHKADLVFLTDEGANGTKAFVSLSNGPSFGVPQLWWTGTGFMYSGIKASLGDVDGNGAEDLVLTTNESTGFKAFVLLSTWQGFLAPQQWLDGAGFGWSGITPMVGDADGDKKADYIFMTDEGANGIKAFMAKSNGSTGFSYTTPQPWVTDTGLMYSGIKMTIGDVDGNGGTDLILTTNESTGSKAFVLESTWQSFLSPQQWWDGTGIVWSGMTPFTGDTDGDKKADYVYMTDEGANGIKVFVGHSNGSTGFSFTTTQPWASVPGWSYSGVKAYLK